MCPSRQCWASVCTARAGRRQPQDGWDASSTLHPPHASPSGKDGLPTLCLWVARKPPREPGAPREREAPQSRGSHTQEPEDARRRARDGDHPERKAVPVRAGCDSGPPQLPSTSSGRLLRDPLPALQAHNSIPGWGDARSESSGPSGANGGGRRVLRGAGTSLRARLRAKCLEGSVSADPHPSERFRALGWQMRSPRQTLTAE